MTDRLSLYNGALRALGERKLASLTENREPRRLLDGVWDSDAYDTWLEQGLWKHAMRTVELTYSPSIQPDFGYQYGFDKPEDFIRTASLSADAFFTAPLLQYSDEAGFWYCEHPTIYVRYVSNDPEYGADLSLWPASFAKYVEHAMAAEICERLTQNASKADKLEKKADKLLKEARSRDAMADPTKFPPMGSWERARRGYARSGSREHG